MNKLIIFVMVVLLVTVVVVGVYSFLSKRVAVLPPPPRVAVLPPPPRVARTQEEAVKLFYELLPVSGSDFQIGYNPEFSKAVVVTVFGATEENFFANKRRAIRFITGLGLSDICAIDIRFVPVEKSVRIKDEDIFAEGCSKDLQLK